jgi:tetratricopeptide (TPR) repeat protein
MEQLKKIIKNDILPNIECLNGFAIYKYNDSTYDIYIPSLTIASYYFISYDNGFFYDLYSKPVSILNIDCCEFFTKQIIEENFERILKYSEIFIEEHEMLNYGEYQSPIDTDVGQYLDLAYEAEEMEDFYEAYNNYCEAIFLEPYNSILYAKRARCYLKFKQFDEAIDDLCRGGISNPISKQNIFSFTFEEIGNIYRIAYDIPNAIKYYTIAYENTNFNWLLQKRAACYSSAGIFILAIQDLEDFLARDRSIGVLYQLGETYAKLGSINEAKITLEEVISFSSANKEEWVSKMIENFNRPFKEKAAKLLSQL